MDLDVEVVAGLARDDDLLGLLGGLGLPLADDGLGGDSLLFDDERLGGVVGPPDRPADGEDDQDHEHRGYGGDGFERSHQTPPYSPSA